MVSSGLVTSWRFINILFLFGLWFYQDTLEGSFLFIVLLALLASLRFRFRMPPWTIFIDIALCLVFTPFWSGAVYGIILPIFESVKTRKWVLFVFCLFLYLVLTNYSPLGYWLVFQAAFIGFLVTEWEKQRGLYTAEADRERHARYDLEQIRNELLEANKKTAHLAELSERNRIARALHDHLGHDLTGAKMAMDALQHLDGSEAEEMLNQVKKRIERSTLMLRYTVHDMTPVMRTGADRLTEIIEGFNHINVEMKQAGDMNSIPVQYWSILEPCLKEALTNTVRHSDATNMIVQLDATEALVRLSIMDNGNRTNKVNEGSGLRHLKLRARSVGGSLSVSNQSGFLIVCVLPLTNGKENEE